LYLNSDPSRFETINPSTANAEVTTLDLTIEACSGDEDSILKAATFMVDTFWLGTDETTELVAACLRPSMTIAPMS